MAGLPLDPRLSGVVEADLQVGPRLRRLQVGACLADTCGKILPIELGSGKSCRPMWILRTLIQDQPEKTFRITPGGIRTVGRAAGADFIVDAALVSRVHCRLTAFEDGALEVRDLESTNGTFVNGQRVDFARLTDGDRLQVGRVEMTVSRETA